MTHKKPAATYKSPENTGTTRWWTFLKITGFFAFGFAGFFITPYMQVGNDLTAHFIYAFMALTLYIFILLLIYLYAYKEELSGFISKILKIIKNFTLNIWQKINSIKKPLKTFALFAVLVILLTAECFLIYKVIESFNLHLEKIIGLPNDFNFSLKSDKLSEIQDIRNSTFFYSFGSLLILLSIALPFIKSALKNHILHIFVTTVISGGILAFIIPVFLYNYGFIGDTKDLTTALLGVTGGVVALFSLIKSHQKSELEREQLDTQKQKDARDHIRQLHNSYNDRFDKAVAELNGSDVKASYTAVPKLAKLADAWLDYKDLSNDTKELEKLKDKAEKEAQTIINILCKYIRTIPNNYTHEQLKEFKSLPESDIEILTHEADIRRLIFSEISKRSSTFTRDGFGKIIDTYTGTWSDFEFDFSRAPIFYPLSSLTIEKGNFSSAKFYSNADFSGATFTQTADFSKATFTQNANFSWATFTQTADFESATFTQTARFHVTKFTQDANFRWATFTQTANFRWATFTQTANFRSATFTQTANFRSATFERFEPTFATKLGKARFSAGTSPQNYMFSVAPDSKPINCKPATLLGKTFIIPLGTVLFDPDSPPKDHLGNYTVQSASAE